MRVNDLHYSIYLYIHSDNKPCTSNLTSLSTAIECPALVNLTNGAILYASDTTAPYDFETTATHSCNPGYFLVGEKTRSCGGNGSSTTGEWDLSEPSCGEECKSAIKASIYLLH